MRFSCGNLSVASRGDFGSIGSAEAARGAHVNASEWLATVVCSEINVERDGEEYKVKRQIGDVSQVLSSRADREIKAIREYRHLFNARIGAGGALSAKHLGLFHSFTLLELEGGDYVCVEKFNDALELMVGRGDLFRQYALLFRATGDERPLNAQRPVIAQERR